MSWRPFVFGDVQLFLSKFKRYNLWDLSYLRQSIMMIVSCLFIILSFINFQKYHLNTSVSIFLMNAWHCIVSRLWSQWKKYNLFGFFVFEPIFIGVGIARSIFSLMAANISIHIIVRGVVTSLDNVRLSQICLLVLQLDIPIRDWWLGENSFHMWKRLPFFTLM